MNISHLRFKKNPSPILFIFTGVWFITPMSLPSRTYIWVTSNINSSKYAQRRTLLEFNLRSRDSNCLIATEWDPGKDNCGNGISVGNCTWKGTDSIRRSQCLVRNWILLQPSSVNEKNDTSGSSKVQHLPLWLEDDRWRPPKVARWGSDQLNISNISNWMEWGEGLVNIYFLSV